MRNTSRWIHWSDSVHLISAWMSNNQFSGVSWHKREIALFFMPKTILLIIQMNASTQYLTELIGLLPQLLTVGACSRCLWQQWQCLTLTIQSDYFCCHNNRQRQHWAAKSTLWLIMVWARLESNFRETKPWSCLGLAMNRWRHCTLNGCECSFDSIHLIWRSIGATWSIRSRYDTCGGSGSASSIPTWYTRPQHLLNSL